MEGGLRKKFSPCGASLRSANSDRCSIRQHRSKHARSKRCSFCSLDWCVSFVSGSSLVLVAVELGQKRRPACSPAPPLLLRLCALWIARMECAHMGRGAVQGAHFAADEANRAAAVHEAQREKEKGKGKGKGKGREARGEGNGAHDRMYAIDWLTIGSVVCPPAPSLALPHPAFSAHLLSVSVRVVERSLRRSSLPSTC